MSVSIRVELAREENGRENPSAGEEAITIAIQLYVLILLISLAGCSVE